MATITLKNVDPNLHHLLKEQARKHGRSLNREILVELERMVHSAAMNSAGLLARARQVREASSVYLTQRELNQFKKEGRS